MIVYRAVEEEEEEEDIRVAGPSLRIKMGGGQSPQTETEESRESREDEQRGRAREKARAGERAEATRLIPGVSGSGARVGSHPAKETGGGPSHQLPRPPHWAETETETETERGRGGREPSPALTDTSRQTDLTGLTGLTGLTELTETAGRGKRRGRGNG